MLAYDLIMRVMDGLMSIPAILLAIALTAVTTASTSTVIFAITVVELPRVVRLVRRVVLTVREQAFVEAAVIAGTRPGKRSEERRVGQECVRKCRYRLSTSH